MTQHPPAANHRNAGRRYLVDVGCVLGERAAPVLRAVDADRVRHVPAGAPPYPTSPTLFPAHARRTAPRPPSWPQSAAFPSGGNRHPIAAGRAEVWSRL